MPARAQPVVAGAEIALAPAIEYNAHLVDAAAERIRNAAGVIAAVLIVVEDNIFIVRRSSSR
jgi:hypothetical protein